MIRFALTALLVLGIGFTAFAAETADAPKVERLTADKWCATHDLPKDKCVECNKKLIPQLKKDKDWCPEHACAESTCVKCNPKDAKALLDAQRPAATAK